MQAEYYKHEFESIVTLNKIADGYYEITGEKLTITKEHMDG